MFVVDVMTVNPVTVRAGTSIKAALALLARYSVTSLPVVADNHELRGVVSEVDLIRDCLPRDPRATDLSLPPASDSPPPRFVGQVATPHVLRVRVHEDLSRAVDLMTSNGIKSLPVLDASDRVVGIVSRSDVVRALARSDGALKAEIEQLLISLGHAAWLVEVSDGEVVVVGPSGPAERSLAEMITLTVPGVVRARVD